MSRTSSKGAAGESIAAAYLGSLGWTIIATNYVPETRRLGAGETDIIAISPDGILVFCEVKFHKHAGVFPPMTAAAVRRRVAGAHAFLAENPSLANMDCRFDVLFVLPDRTVGHVRSAFIGE
ncbi:MAG: YraN family protein [Alphaproteobacteria bacterium]|nr:YraN family protein [Alphaproteobacteria bacterium]